MGRGHLLDDLGVGHHEEDLYRFFLRQPDARVEDAASALHIERAEVEVVFEQLSARGLVREVEHHVVVTADPVAAVEKLIDARMRTLSRDMRVVARTRSAIPSLLEDQQFGRDHASVADIERIVGLDAIRARLDDLAFFARGDVLALQPDGALSAAYIDSARPLDLRCLRRGVTLRTVVLRAAVDDPPTLAYLRELGALGAQIRTVEAPLERMLVYDRGIAVVPLDPAISARGALVISQPSLVSNMVTLFERVWAAGRPLDPGRSDDHVDCVLEKQILSILARTNKDEIAAREMGVSVRTFRRHVADVMSRLGHPNRFQAGLIAKGRGWI